MRLLVLIDWGHSDQKNLMVFLYGMFVQGMQSLGFNWTCWPPGMTEESRHIQLTNQINFVPALCGPSNMNAFTIFIQNSSLVDNYSTPGKYKRYIDMDD